jgi:hypothetical protein
MKTRSKRTVRRKSRRTVSATKKPHRAPRSKAASSLDRTLKQLKRAVNVTLSKADAVLASAEAIANLAVTRTKAQLVSALLEDEVLTALYSLPQGNETVSALRLYSRWLREHLALEAIYEQGQLLDVPEGRLRAFDLVDGSCPPTTGVCTIQIVTSGWKQGSKVLRKPVVSFTERR